VLGGFDVTSKTTLLIPLTLFIILLEIDCKNFLSKLKKSMIIKKLSKQKEQLDRIVI